MRHAVPYLDDRLVLPQVPDDTAAGLRRRQNVLDLSVPSDPRHIVCWLLSNTRKQIYGGNNITNYLIRQSNAQKMRPRNTMLMNPGIAPHTKVNNKQFSLARFFLWHQNSLIHCEQTDKRTWLQTLPRLVKVTN